jgi:16S rRNA (guanine966-N2)-methyltransferase
MLETLLSVARPGASEGDEPVEPGMAEVWRGLVVTDLYAGTGALGIEALSRGAAWCDFVEADSSARRVIERNLAVTGLADRARIVSLDVRKVVARKPVPSLRAPYGLALLDPPYADPSIVEVLGRLASAVWLERDALVGLEHSRRVALPSLVPSAVTEDATETGMALVELKQRRHGDTILSIYRWTEPGDRGVSKDGDEGDLSG